MRARVRPWARTSQRLLSVAGGRPDSEMTGPRGPHVTITIAAMNAFNRLGAPFRLPVAATA